MSACSALPVPRIFLGIESRSTSLAIVRFGVYDRFHVPQALEAPEILSMPDQAPPQNKNTQLAN